MKKIQNHTLNNFMEKLIKSLKSENKHRENYTDKKQLDIPFIISSLYQKFDKSPENFSEFTKDLENWNIYDIEISNSHNTYNGIIDVEVNLLKFIESNNEFSEYDSPDYTYRLSFAEDTRHWGYCECTSDMKDYREDKDCCGHGCDATFVEFSLCKMTEITKGNWSGDEHDYWNFEDSFYEKEKELLDEKNKKSRLEEIERLKNEIEKANTKLLELEKIELEKGCD